MTHPPGGVPFCYLECGKLSELKNDRLEINWQWRNRGIDRHKDLHECHSSGTIPFVLRIDQNATTIAYSTFE
jgi:hypothetical protein